MKIISVFAMLSVCSVLGAQTLNQSVQTANPSALPGPIPYSVVGYQIGQQGANSRVWQKVIQTEDAKGNSVLQTNQAYVELASGLNHWQNSQWVPSTENIVISLDGNSAAATNGQHQVYFPGNIYNGVIKLVTPDGGTLQSQPIGLSYYDGNKSVLIAVLTNSTGEILPSGNQVIYANAFTGLDADLLYTYTRSGFEQDIVLRSQPPDPASLGLNPQNARLQVLTEFFNSPQPAVSAMTVPTAAGNVEDDSLSFGTMQMVQGKAFLLGTNSPTAEVNKQWLVLNGRQFLVEEVPIVSIAKQIDSLPLFAAKTGIGSKTFASRNPVLPLPPQRLGRAAPKTRFLAQATHPSRGLVLDYVTLNSYTNNITFQGDTTYFLSGLANLTGTSTFEGGAVIKYTNGGGLFLNAVKCSASAYRPVIFTTMNDNSVGETINGSTGIPTNSNTTLVLTINEHQTEQLQNLRIDYAGFGIFAAYDNVTIKDCQFVNDLNPVRAVGCSLNLENVLMYNVAGTALYPNVGTLCIAQNLTVHNANTFLTCGSGSSLCLTNSLLIACTNLGSSFNGASNYANISDVGIFQIVGAGDNYLATNCPIGIRAAGTTNIDPALLADLQTKTTYPPMVYVSQTISNDLPLSPQAPRDTCLPGPDLGYHYDPIDYAIGGLIVTNATMTVSPGTVIAAFGNGLDIGPGGKLVCEGSATDLNRIVTYNTVQEGAGAWQPPWLASVTDYFSGAGGSFDFRFTDWSFIGAINASHLIVGSDPVNFRDCQFHGSSLVTFYPTINLTNCLFDRVDVVINPMDDGIPVLRNNLFYGGTLDLLPFNSNHAVVQDNLFDRTTVVDYSSSYTYTGGNNAYVTNYSRLHPFADSDVILTNPPAYQTGPLGAFYEPTNSPLIDAGSTNVDAAGLTGYTILTNQTPDTGPVDIGYHYKIIGNDSTGTDFWLAFFSLEAQGEEYFPVDQSLNISSPVATAGTVTYPVNGPVLTITNDPAVNGTYVLTNTPESEMDSYSLSSNMYVNGNLQVVYIPNSMQWDIWNYVPNHVQIIYFLNDYDPTGSDWISYDGTGPGVTTLCPPVSVSQPFSVAAGGVTNVALPMNVMLDGYDTVENKGVHVTASQPVSVYEFSYTNADSSAFTAYPTPMLGTNYCVMARASESQYGDSAFHSQFAIVGTVTNTTVRIAPSATANLYNHTGAYSIQLNQGDTYEINSSDTLSDVTGTTITSDKPIALFAGANQANVPNNSTGAANPLDQEQLPVTYWGTNVAAISFAGRLNGDTYRVLAYTNTTVTVTNSFGICIVTNLTNGMYLETNLDGWVWFQANQSIQVAQFENGNFFDYPQNPNEGDPCEILLLPAGHYLTSYTVFAPTNSSWDFITNYVNLIVAQTGIGTTLLDENLLSATNFTTIGSSGYYGARIPVAPGTHTIHNSEPIEVQTYGLGYQDAYGYFGGWSP